MSYMKELDIRLLCNARRASRFEKDKLAKDLPSDLVQIVYTHDMIAPAFETLNTV